MTETGNNAGGILSKIRADLRDVRPYAAVEPPERVADRFGIPHDRILKLDANENPYGCSPRVAEALARCDRYHIYPDVICAECRDSISRYVGVDPDRIVVGNGSDEIIDLVFRLFLNPGDVVISCPPTFGYYAASVASCGGVIRSVERKGYFDLDIPGILSQLDETVKVIVIASPNNPTGNCVHEEDLTRLLDTGLPVMVDEAYGEFSGKSAIPLIARYDNLIVLRTFSKWAGLAGLRAGYGIFSQVLADYIIKIKPPYNVSQAAQAAIKASLEDVDYLLDRVKTIVVERDRLLAELRGMGYLEPYPSEANFILCKVTRGTLAHIRAMLEMQGIFLRYYDDPRLQRNLRISVGTPEQNDILLKSLREIGESV